MHRVRVVSTWVVAVVCAVGLAGLGAPSTAQADRCQPEELLLNGQTVMNEADNPVCIVALRVVYPALSCNSMSLMMCLNTLDPAATLTMAPSTAAQTPGRAMGAVSEIPAATIRAARDGCFLDIRFTATFIQCRAEALRNRIPIAR